MVRDAVDTVTLQIFYVSGYCLYWLAEGISLAWHTYSIKLKHFTFWLETMRQKTSHQTKLSSYSTLFYSAQPLQRYWFNLFQRQNMVIRLFSVILQVGLFGVYQKTKQFELLLFGYLITSSSLPQVILFLAFFQFSRPCRWFSAKSGTMRIINFLIYLPWFFP